MDIPTEVNPKFWLTHVWKIRVSESFSINVMAQLACLDLRKTPRVTDPPGRQGWHQG